MSTRDGGREPWSRASEAAQGFLAGLNIHRLGLSVFILIP